MSALIILLILGIWCVVAYNAGYYLSAFIKRKWIRRAVGVAALIGLTTLALWDEVLGAKEFEKLCLSSATLQIIPTEKGKKFDLRYSITDGAMLEGFALPIREYFTKYTDKPTGLVIANGKTYSLYGGRLVRFLGGHPMGTGDKPLMSESTCAVIHQNNFAANRLRELSNSTTK